MLLSNTEKIGLLVDFKKTSWEVIKNNMEYKTRDGDDKANMGFNCIFGLVLLHSNRRNNKRVVAQFYFKNRTKVYNVEIISQEMIDDLLNIIKMGTLEDAKEWIKYKNGGKYGI